MSYTKKNIRTANNKYLNGVMTTSSKLTIGATNDELGDNYRAVPFLPFKGNPLDSHKYNSIESSGYINMGDNFNARLLIGTLASPFVEASAVKSNDPKTCSAMFHFMNKCKLVNYIPLINDINKRIRYNKNVISLFPYLAEISYIKETNEDFNLSLNKHNCGSFLKNKEQYYYKNGKIYDKKTNQVVIAAENQIYKNQDTFWGLVSKDNIIHTDEYRRSIAEFNFWGINNKVHVFNDGDIDNVLQKALNDKLKTNGVKYNIKQFIEKQYDFKTLFKEYVKTQNINYDLENNILTLENNKYNIDFDNLTFINIETKETLYGIKIIKDNKNIVYSFNIEQFILQDLKNNFINYGFDKVDNISNIKNYNDEIAVPKDMFKDLYKKNPNMHYNHIFNPANNNYKDPRDDNDKKEISYYYDVPIINMNKNVFNDSSHKRQYDADYRYYGQEISNNKYNVDYLNNIDNAILNYNLVTGNQNIACIYYAIGKKDWNYDKDTNIYTLPDMTVTFSFLDKNQYCLAYKDNLVLNKISPIEIQGYQKTNSNTTIKYDKTLTDEEIAELEAMSRLKNKVVPLYESMFNAFLYDINYDNINYKEWLPFSINNIPYLDNNSTTQQTPTHDKLDVFMTYAIKYINSTSLDYIDYAINPIYQIKQAYFIKDFIAGYTSFLGIQLNQEPFFEEYFKYAPLLTNSKNILFRFDKHLFDLSQKINQNYLEIELENGEIILINTSLDNLTKTLKYIEKTIQFMPNTLIYKGTSRIYGKMVEIDIWQGIFTFIHNTAKTVLTYYFSSLTLEAAAAIAASNPLTAPLAAFLKGLAIAAMIIATTALASIAVAVIKYGGFRVHSPASRFGFNKKQYGDGFYNIGNKWEWIYHKNNGLRFDIWDKFENPKYVMNTNGNKNLKRIKLKPLCHPSYKDREYEKIMLQHNERPFIFTPYEDINKENKYLKGKITDNEKKALDCMNSDFSYSFEKYLSTDICQSITHIYKNQRFSFTYLFLEQFRNIKLLCKMAYIYCEYLYNNFGSFIKLQVPHRSDLTFNTHYLNIQIQDMYDSEKLLHYNSYFAIIRNNQLFIYNKIKMKKAIFNIESYCPNYKEYYKDILNINYSALNFDFIYKIYQQPIHKLKQFRKFECIETFGIYDKKLVNFVNNFYADYNKINIDNHIDTYTKDISINKLKYYIEEELNKIDDNKLLKIYNKENNSNFEKIQNSDVQENISLDAYNTLKQFFPTNTIEVSSNDFKEIQRNIAFYRNTKIRNSFYELHNNDLDRAYSAYSLDKENTIKSLDPVTLDSNVSISMYNLEQYYKSVLKTIIENKLEAYRKEIENKLGTSDLVSIHLNLPHNHEKYNIYCSLSQIDSKYSHYTIMKKILLDNIDAYFNPLNYLKEKYNPNLLDGQGGTWFGSFFINDLKTELIEKKYTDMVWYRYNKEKINVGHEMEKGEVSSGFFRPMIYLENYTISSDMFLFGKIEGSSKLDPHAIYPRLITYGWDKEANAPVENWPYIHESDRSPYCPKYNDKGERILDDNIALAIFLKLQENIKAIMMPNIYTIIQEIKKEFFETIDNTPSFSYTTQLLMNKIVNHKNIDKTAYYDNTTINIMQLLHLQEKIDNGTFDRYINFSTNEKIIEKNIVLNYLKDKIINTYFNTDKYIEYEKVNNLKQDKLINELFDINKLLEKVYTHLYVTNNIAILTQYNKNNIKSHFKKLVEIDQQAVRSLNDGDCYWSPYLPLPAKVYIRLGYSNKIFIEQYSNIYEILYDNIIPEYFNDELADKIRKLTRFLSIASAIVTLAMVISMVASTWSGIVKAGYTTLSIIKFGITVITLSATILNTIAIITGNKKLARIAGYINEVNTIASLAVGIYDFNNLTTNEAIQLSLSIMNKGLSLITEYETKKVNKEMSNLNSQLDNLKNKYNQIIKDYNEEIENYNEKIILNLSLMK